MDPVEKKIREVHKAIDSYIERWVAEGDGDEEKLKKGVEARLILSGLPQETFPFMRREAEGKKRWELHLKGALAQDEFGS